MDRALDNLNSVVSSPDLYVGLSRSCSKLSGYQTRWGTRSGDGIRDGGGGGGDVGSGRLWAVSDAFRFQVAVGWQPIPSSATATSVRALMSSGCLSSISSGDTFYRHVHSDKTTWKSCTGPGAIAYYYVRAYSPDLSPNNVSDQLDPPTAAAAAA